MQTFNHSPWEAEEAGGSKVQGTLGLCLTLAHNSRSSNYSNKFLSNSLPLFPNFFLYILKNSVVPLFLSFCLSVLELVPSSLHMLSTCFAPLSRAPGLPLPLSLLCDFGVALGLGFGEVPVLTPAGSTPFSLSLLLVGVFTECLEAPGCCNVETIEGQKPDLWGYPSSLIFSA